MLLETGRADAAAALFDTVYHSIADVGRPSRSASDRAWVLTLRASALAAAGDTALLAPLADTIQALGAQSGYGRDPLLHHHIRGLLLVARGDPAGAEHEFRAAIFSPTAGYTRTNLELARVLIELDRPAEAVPLLQAALRAPLDGPELYVTRTEIHRMLALAFHAAGAGDSAKKHYRIALDAWDHADPILQPQVEELRRYARLLDAGGANRARVRGH
jgi:tetratricopeptide (TPR) repeat protein